MQLNSVTDPRSLLDRATRKELQNFAKSRGVNEIVCGMPAPLMREILRMQGVTDIGTLFPYLHNRKIGQMSGVNQARNNARAPSTDQGQTSQVVDATTDLMRQWKAQQGQTAGDEGSTPSTSNNGGDGASPRGCSLKMHEVRAECKKRGISFTRHDKKAVLLGRLQDGKDAS